MKTDWLFKLLVRLRLKGRSGGAERGSQPDPKILMQMVRGIVTTRPDEIGCDECFEQVDRFAEMVLDGKDAASALPLVQDHLNRCGDCREEFEALLEALRSLT